MTHDKETGIRFSKLALADPDPDEEAPSGWHVEKTDCEVGKLRHRVYEIDMRGWLGAVGAIQVVPTSKTQHLDPDPEVVPLQVATATDDPKILAVMSKRKIAKRPLEKRPRREHREPKTKGLGKAASRRPKPSAQGARAEGVAAGAGVAGRSRSGTGRRSRDALPVKKRPRKRAADASGGGGADTGARGGGDAADTGPSGEQGDDSDEAGPPPSPHPAEEELLAFRRLLRKGQRCQVLREDKPRPGLVPHCALLDTCAVTGRSV